MKCTCTATAIYEPVKHPFRAVIMSPYLKNSKYSPNLSNESRLTSNEGREIEIIKPGSCIDNFYFRDQILKLSEIGDLGIFGSCPGSEKAVELLQNSGLPIARYSKFYRGVSSYTGKSPEDGGYSFDIPKDLEIVKRFLTNDMCLSGILECDEDRIRRSLDELNGEHNMPILITPFLSKALSIRKRDR